MQFTLEFAGVGPLEGDLRDLARRLGLGERVIFHGALADMNAFYQDMHLLLHTALREPCANVVPEAHAHGLPCLATLIDGMPELLPEGSHKLLLKPTEDLDAYQELGASGGAMAPWVYDPSSDSLEKPRFVAPTACAEAILELWNTDGAYEQASLRAVNLVRDEFLPEMAIGRAVRELGGIAKGGRGN
jgi:glycosyltransferase involved in cell wall biosynthesis